MNIAVRIDSPEQYDKLSKLYEWFEPWGWDAEDDEDEPRYFWPDPDMTPTMLAGHYSKHHLLAFDDFVKVLEAGYRPVTVAEYEDAVARMESLCGQAPAITGSPISSLYEGVFDDELPLDSNDPVHKPAHYTRGKIECIDFIKDQGLGFELGNALKYIVRAGHKDPSKTREDLEKAIWYINSYLKTL